MSPIQIEIEQSLATKNYFTRDFIDADSAAVLGVWRDEDGMVTVDWKVVPAQGPRFERRNTYQDVGEAIEKAVNWL